MPRQSGSTRSTRRGCALREQSTASPNIMHNFSLRSKSLKNKDASSKKQYQVIGEQVSKHAIEIYEDQPGNSVSYKKRASTVPTGEENINPSENSNQNSTNNSISTQHSQNEKITEDKSIQCEIIKDISTANKSKSTAILDSIILQENPQNLNFWKKKSENLEKSFNELENKFNQLELDYKKQITINNKQNSANEFLKQENEKLIQTVDERDAQILELTEMLESELGDDDPLGISLDQSAPGDEDNQSQDPRELSLNLSLEEGLDSTVIERSN
jgi:hypothetical protein